MTFVKFEEILDDYFKYFTTPHPIIVYVYEIYMQRWQSFQDKSRRLYIRKIVKTFATFFLWSVNSKMMGWTSQPHQN